MSSMSSRCLGAALGLLTDRVVGEPPTSMHPVAWFGSTMGRVETRLWADRRDVGVLYTTAGVAIGAGTGRLLPSTTIMVALCAAGRELRAVAERIRHSLSVDDLELARNQLPSLVGRDPSQLDSEGISAAVIESVAENSVDAVIAPVFWAVVAGPAGAAAYRAVNTMDAMVGHRNDRYRNFGWSAARLDDVANYVPARFFAALVAIQTPARASAICAIVRRDAPAHPSPNAGVAEASMAAALGCELGGPLRYGELHEDRPRLGSGPRPGPADVSRAIRIADRAELTAVGLLILAWATRAFRTNE